MTHEEKVKLYAMKTFKNLKSDRKKELAVSFLKTKQKQKFFDIKKNHSFQKI